MNSGTWDRAERRRTMWLGCATLALITILGVVVRRTAGASAPVTVAGVYAGGALLMAWLTSRATAYPRWAWYASAGIFALTLAAAAVLLPRPEQMKQWMSTAWMLPWLYLVTALSPAPATGRCSPSSPWAGPLLLVTSALFSAILLGAWWLER